MLRPADGTILGSCKKYIQSQMAQENNIVVQIELGDDVCTKN